MTHRPVGVMAFAGVVAAEPPLRGYLTASC